MEYDGDGSSGNEQYISASNNNEGKRSSRHTSQQIEKLDAYFKECPHPDESQRLILGKELNMEPDQVKFWFQNKRTQSKAQDERSSNILLRAENQKLQCENEAMREALKNVVCPPCGGPPVGIDEREGNIKKLRLENARLKQQRDELAKFVTKNKLLNRPIMVDPLASVHRQQIYDTLFDLPSSLGPPTSQTVQPQARSQRDIVQYSEAAANAVDELKQLFSNENVFWIKSSVDGEYMIDEARYEKFFHAIRHFRNPGARVESSKDAAVVSIEATNLIDMFLDSEKWKDLFPTIVYNAKTIHMFGSDVRIKENCNVVQVIWEKLHILSPLVAAREFLIVRCCQQIKKGLWIIADVSHNIGNNGLVNVDAPCYKRPSGCLIQALPDGQSKVMWIEHVEVDDKPITHQMYKEILFGRSGYGAKRWIATLERMCERMVLSSIPTNPPNDWVEDIMPEKGRRCVMKLGERMFKLYNEMLIMSGKVNFPQQSNSVRISARLNCENGQPPGLVLCGATSLAFSLTPLQVFNILTNNETRHKWDVLCHESPVTEITRLFTAPSETNRITILKPTENLGIFMMTQDTGNNDMLMLQDCYMDKLGGMIVYAPLDQKTMDITVSGEVDACHIPILPSGFIISNDGQRSTEGEDGGGGTLLTVIFQILSSGGPRKPTEKQVHAVSTLMSTTIQNVKALLVDSPHV